MKDTKFSKSSTRTKISESLSSLYNLKPEVFIKYTDKVYKAKCNDQDYCIKCTEYLDDGKISEHIEALGIDTFLMPIKTNIRTTYANNKGIKFYVTPWVEKDNIASKDIKLKYYLSKIGQLHEKTSFSSDVSQSYYKELVARIEELQQETYQKIDKMMSEIERIDYKSPSEWYFTNNFYRLIESLDKSKGALNKLKEICSSKSSIRQVITHQNFSFDHIFISKDKIIGNDKMKIAPPIEDLLSVFYKTQYGSIDVSGLMGEYFKYNQLEEYEKYWLLANLYIPQITKTKKNDYETLTSYMKVFFTYLSVSELQIKMGLET